jgi:hypothetical protein
MLLSAHFEAGSVRTPTSSAETSLPSPCQESSYQRPAGKGQRETHCCTERFPVSLFPRHCASAPPASARPCRCDQAAILTWACCPSPSPHTVAAPNHQHPVLNWLIHIDPLATHHPQHRHHHSNRCHYQPPPNVPTPSLPPRGPIAASSAAGSRVHVAGVPHTAQLRWHLR